MITLVMIVLEKLMCGILERKLTEEDQLLQRFLFDASHEPLNMR